LSRVTSISIIAISLLIVACNLTGKLSYPDPIPETALPVTVTPGIEQPTLTPPVSPTASTPGQSPFPPTVVAVYTSENNIYVWKDGASKKLTDSGDAYNPRLSTDREWIAFSRPIDDYHLEIWGIRTDGTDERRLVSSVDLDALGATVRDPNARAIIPNSEFAWQPGTHKLAFSTQQIFQGPGMILLDDVNRVDIESGEINTLFAPGSGGMFKYSLDGKKISISQPDKIMLANADGSGYQTVLTYEPVITYSEYRYYAEPVWSQDGEILLVAIPPPDPLAKPGGMTEIWQINASEGHASKLGAVDTVAFMEQPTTFSPDMKWMAYLHEIGLPESNQRELHVAHPDGSEDRVIATAAPLFFLGWSTNSSDFLYSTGQDQTLWVGKLDGSPKQLDDQFIGVQSAQWINSDWFFYWVSKTASLDLYLGSIVSVTSSQIATTFNSRPFLSFIP